jgi:hypothetical protein
VRAERLIDRQIRLDVRDGYVPPYSDVETIRDPRDVEIEVELVEIVPVEVVVPELVREDSVHLGIAVVDAIKRIDPETRIREPFEARERLLEGKSVRVQLVGGWVVAAIRGRRAHVQRLIGPAIELDAALLDRFADVAAPVDGAHQWVDGRVWNPNIRSAVQAPVGRGERRRIKSVRQ